MVRPAASVRPIVLKLTSATGMLIDPFQNQAATLGVTIRPVL